MIKPQDFHRLIAPRPAVLVTTVDEKGREDVSTFSWITPVSFDPPLIALAIGPNKHSYWNITRINEFVVNIPTEKMLEKVWIAGGPWDPTQSKIQRAKLKTKPAEKVRPPLLSECPVNLECIVENARKAGDHVIVIGRVVKIHAKDDAVDDKGNLKVDVIRPPLHVADNLFAFPYVTKTV